MPVTEVTPFACPNCGAQYKLVRVETNEILPDRQLTCRRCGGPLRREGKFILKYFLVDRPVEGLSGGDRVSIGGTLRNCKKGGEQ